PLPIRKIPSSHTAIIAMRDEEQSRLSKHALGRVREVPSGSRRLARTLAALSDATEYARYEADPPPCDRTHRTP
ncbi:hypothetical protein AB0E17_29895, partial [Streptomyces niveus]